MYIIKGKGSLARLIAGVLVIASVALGYWVSPFFFLLTLFVGTMLILSFVVGYCPSELLLKALKVEERVPTKK